MLWNNLEVTSQAFDQSHTTTNPRPPAVRMSGLRPCLPLSAQQAPSVVEAVQAKYVRLDAAPCIGASPALHSQQQLPFNNSQSNVTIWSRIQIYFCRRVCSVSFAPLSLKVAFAYRA